MGEKVWVILVVWGCVGMSVEGELKSYGEGLDRGVGENDDYRVGVGMGGGEWEDVFE